MENRKECIGWVDWLRVAACFCVVLAHCCDPFVASFENDAQAFYTGVFTGSLLRPSVPLFVMITGLLLLPVKTDMRGFYRKRIGRLIYPLVFWSLVLPLIYYGYLNFINPETQNAALSMSEHTWEETVKKFVGFIFNFNYDTTPMWYLYMLVGLYLVMPIVSGWLEKASRNDLRLFLSIWGISLLLPYIKIVAPFIGYTGNFGNMGLWGVCDWNEFGALYYFSGFIGYMLLGYYLVKYPLQWSWSKMLSITVPMFVAGYLVTSFGFVEMQKWFPGNYAYLEIIWYFSNINVFMMTFPVFVLFQKLNAASSPLISRVASATFGIYLCHFVFVSVSYDLYNTGMFHPVIHILLMAVTAFAVSFVIVRFMQMWKVTNRFVR